METYKKILCFLGFHDYFKWQPYEGIEEIKVNRCKNCDNYHWREV